MRHSRIHRDNLRVFVCFVCTVALLFSSKVYSETVKGELSKEWSDLPTETQLGILKFLEARSISRFSQTSSHSLLLARHPEIAQDQIEKYNEAPNLSLLESAASENRIDILEYFFKVHPAWLAKKYYDNSSALVIALKSGNIHFILKLFNLLTPHQKELNQKHADLMLKLSLFPHRAVYRNHPWNPLNWAVKKRHNDIAFALMARLDSRWLNDSVLNDALEAGNTELAFALISIMDRKQVNYSRKNLNSALLSRDAGLALAMISRIKTSEIISSDIDKMIRIDNSEIIDAIMSGFNSEPMAISENGNNTIHILAGVRESFQKGLEFIDRCSPSHLIQRNADEETPLNIAIKVGHSETALRIMSRLNDEQINLTDGFGLSPLHLAAERGSRNVGIALISRLTPEQINLRDPFGNTPLDIALSFCRNSTSLNAISIANANRNLLASELINHMNDNQGGQMNNLGFTPLQIATLRGCVELEKQLRLKMGIQENWISRWLPF
jgi:ankyrin repeat protein